MTHPPIVPSPTPQSATPNALVCRFGALGDMVMLTPALEVLWQGIGAPSEVVTSLGAAAALYSGMPSVEGVTLVHSKRTPYWLERSQRSFVRNLKPRVAAGAVRGALSFTVVPRVPRLLRKAGIPAQAMATHQGLPRRELEHDVAYGERLVRALAECLEDGFSTPPPDQWPRPQLQASKGEKRDAEAFLRARGWSGEPLVLLQTQSRKPRRGRWPSERWLSLIASVGRRLPETRMLLTGVPSELEAVRDLQSRAADPRVECAAGETSVRRLCALASLAHSMISLDTGPAHIAAAVGCPLVVLFGTEHPDRTRPLPLEPGRVAGVTALPEPEWPRSREGFAQRHRMQDIEPEAVAEAWGRVSAATS